MLLSGKAATKLDNLMKKVELLQIIEIDYFLKLICSDMEANKTVIKYNYSKGLTERHNYNIKVIKQQMQI